MARSARKPSEGDEAGRGADASKRFTMNGHPYRLRYFDVAPGFEPPPGTVVIPSSDGAGVFWLSPELLKILRDGTS